MFYIDSDIPLPKKHPNKGLTDRLRQLQIKQSIIVPLTARNSVATLAEQIKIKIVSKMEYSDKKVMQYDQKLGHEVGVYQIIGIRIWRIA